MNMFQMLMTALSLVALGSSVFYSFHYRRQRDPAAKGLSAAKMNISMGLLLLLFAVMQVAFFEMSSLRMVIGTLFALVGLFNLFAGLKNRSYFQSQMSKPS